MTAISYRVVTYAHLGKRHLVRCHLCRVDLGHYALKVDAVSEAGIHLRRQHDLRGDAA